MPEKSSAAAGRRPRSARRGASFRRRAGGTRVLATVGVLVGEGGVRLMGALPRVASAGVAGENLRVLVRRRFLLAQTRTYVIHAIYQKPEYSDVRIYRKSRGFV
jgi:hypothetical protein